MKQVTKITNEKGVMKIIRVMKKVIKKRRKEGFTGHEYFKSQYFHNKQHLML